MSEELRALIIEQDRSVGDSITISLPVKDTWLGGQFVYIEIDEPWAGDTESGFGRTAHFALSKEQINMVVKHLQACLVLMEQNKTKT